MLYVVLFGISITKFGHVNDLLLIEKIIEVSEGKTSSYQAIGTYGMIVVFVNALLCNLMFIMGVVMSYTSKTIIGKIVAMCIPIFIFFA